MGFSVNPTTDVNIRSGPGTGYDIIGGANNEESFSSLGTAQDENGTTWYKVGDGWVSGDYSNIGDDGAGGESGGGTSIAPQVPIDIGESTTKRVKDELTKTIAGGSGLEGTLSSLLGQSVTGDQALEFYKRRVFGMPCQFLPSTDIRPNGGNLGRIFTSNILTEAPILSILPCKPNYLPSLKEDEKKNIVTAFLDKAGGLASDAAQAAADAAIAKVETRYFSCDLDHTEYMRYVNMLLRATAIFMGLGTSTVPGTTSTYAEYDWAKYRMSNALDNSSIAGTTVSNETLGDIVSNTKEALSNPTDSVLSALSTEQYYVSFFVTPSTSYSESMSNRTEQSAFENLINKGEGMMKELSFLLGANALDSSVLSNSVNNMSDEMKKQLGNYNLTKGDNILSRILTNTQTIVSGSNIIFPEIYHDSEFSRSYRAECKLISPYGSKESIFLHIFVPMMHLLAFVLPRQTTVNTYKAPPLIKAHINKWFSCEMGIVDTVDIAKGGSENSAWTVDGFPTEVTVSISFKDLYSALALSKTDTVGDAYMFMQNEALMEYLSVTCGLDLKKSEYKLKTDLVKALLSKIPTDMIDYKAESMKEEAARKAMNIFRGMSGGRF